MARNPLWDLSNGELQEKMAEIAKAVDEFLKAQEDGWTQSKGDRDKYKANLRQLKAIGKEMEYRMRNMPEILKDE